MAKGDWRKQPARVVKLDNGIEVDLGRANHSCKRCHGSGISCVMIDPKTKAKTAMVCACVKKNSHGSLVAGFTDIEEPKKTSP
jgi:hypothetical protein